MDPRDRVRTLAEEFRAFALKGNVVDLAVGVIIGAAFTRIVDSLVANVLMPLLNSVLPTAQESYTEWAFTLNGSRVPFGKFLGDVINFLLIAVALFLLIRKFLGWVMSLHQSGAVAEETPSLTRDQELLTEIRDLLRKGDATSGTEPGKPPAAC
jgi:large conductance mechanosensitive channel